MPDQAIPEPRQEAATGSEPSQAQVEAIHQRILKQKSHSNGSGWFYWIAALSLMTSVISLAGGHWSFLAGLGITQVFDGFSIGLMKSGAGPWVKGLSFFLDLLAASTFVFIGIFAKRGSKGAYITGMVLYGLDTLILLAFQEWFGAGFHVFALIQIASGFSALKWLNAPHESPVSPAPQAHGGAPLPETRPS